MLVLRDQLDPRAELGTTVTVELIRDASPRFVRTAMPLWVVEPDHDADAGN